MIEQTICRIIESYYRLRIWQDEEESAIRKGFWKLLYVLFYAVFLVIVTISAFLSDDQDERTLLVAALVCSAVIIIKFKYQLLKREEILGFLYDPIFDQSCNDRQDLKIDKKIIFFKRFVRAYIFLAFLGCATITFSCLPMFSNKQRLPLFISFTLTWKYSLIIYWIAFVCMSLGVLLTFIFNLTTTFVWYLMLNYSIEYEVLGNKFRNLGVDKATQVQLKKASKKQNLFQQDLIGLIKAHGHLFETIERFKSFFSTLFFAQIGTGAAYICVSTFILAYIQPNFSQTLVFGVALLHAICDILLVMYLANEIKLKSDQLSYCLFESNWIDQSESCKKLIIIMVEVLKQPQQLVILIYPLNLETFLKIINGAYSLFNFLKSFK